MTEDTTRESITRELNEIADRLKEKKIPPIDQNGGIIIASAPPGARAADQVVVLSGSGITSSPDNPAARMVLTAMRFDPAMRCVAVIRYSEEIIRVCESMLLEIGTFDRAREPPGIPTIDWGVAFCCEQIKGVPDVIYDVGYREKVPLIRILGENPTTVSAMLNRIITRIMNTTFIEE
jgi:hydroxymethylpyrimidine/phosphomethylpyrimidine kinase